MLGGLSTRRYPVGLDPVGAQAEQAASETSRSSRGCWQGRVAHQCAGVADAVGFGRGLSVGDVEAALAEALGPEAALSTPTVARIGEAIKHQFDAWRHRGL
jgi:hypothetical protein